MEPVKPPQSGENQVFQFMYTATRSDWADGAKTTATAYLWIPERTSHLRGLLVMGTNVPEHMLVGNAEIRAVAAANDLGIVWSSPSFWYSKGQNEHKTIAAFLQQLLDGLANNSGYEEVATVPWLPLGESGHLLMVDALVEAAPDRCIAGIWLKNPHMPPHNRTVPALVIFGTAQEWGQDKADFKKVWQDTSFYNAVIEERRKNPDWPLTFLIDGNSGHFDVSPELVRYLAHYIDAVVKARLPRGAQPVLHPVDLDKGYLADLAVPGHTPKAPAPYSSVAASDRALPWYFDRKSASDAQSFAAIDWQAQSPLIGFTDGSGKVLPFDFNGINNLKPTMDADGVTFHLRPILLDKLPANFLHAGDSVAKPTVTPILEWMCGATTPAGGDALRVSMDRSYRQQANYYVARIPASPGIRAMVQPVGIKLEPNHEGARQTIDFAKPKDVKVGTKSISLEAHSDSGLPVGFFVVAGPATIIGNRLVFTAIPPRTKFPVEVTVAAWQWGRPVEPKVQSAETVGQTFLINR
jgi:hypothetical protein